MKKLIVLSIAMMLVLGTITIYAADNPEVISNDSIEAMSLPETDQVVVYYLHMNRRCMTCEKLEAYSKEAVDAAFAAQLKDSSIVFRVENFESEGNEHFAKDYKLYSQSLILSRQHEGKETEWKSLDKIWELVGDKDKFIAYVQTEISSFLNPKSEE